MTFREFIRLRKRDAIVMGAFAIGAIIFAGAKPPSPPIIQERGIKVVSYSAPTSGGVEMSWKVEDERIKVGEDEFVIYIQERQIPSRTGWSRKTEVGRTKELHFKKDGFWRNRDVVIWVEVDKGAIE